MKLPNYTFVLLLIWLVFVGHNKTAYATHGTLVSFSLTPGVFIRKDADVTGWCTEQGSTVNTISIDLYLYGEEFPQIASWKKELSATYGDKRLSAEFRVDLRLNENGAGEVEFKVTRTDESYARDVYLDSNQWSQDAPVSWSEKNVKGVFDEQICSNYFSLTVSEPRISIQ